MIVFSIVVVDDVMDTKFLKRFCWGLIFARQGPRYSHFFAQHHNGANPAPSLDDMALPISLTRFVREFLHCQRCILTRQIVTEA